MTRQCKECGTDISERAPCAQFCIPCADERHKRGKSYRGMARDSQAHKPRRHWERSARCICCGNKFAPTKTRTRLCLPCWSGPSGMVEHSVAVAGR